MIGPWFYSATFVFLLFTVAPIGYVLAIITLLGALGMTPSDASSSLILLGAYVGNAIISVWVWRSSSSSALSFWDGLKIISARSMSGCANITLIYIYPLLFFEYLTAAYHTLQGLSRGPDYPRMQWIRQVLPELRSQPTGPTSQPIAKPLAPTVGGPTDTLKKCPYCAEMIKADAVICRYCGHDTRVPVSPPRMPVSSTPAADDEASISPSPINGWKGPPSYSSNVPPEVVQSYLGPPPPEGRRRSSR